MVHKHLQAARKSHDARALSALQSMRQSRHLVTVQLHPFTLEETQQLVEAALDLGDGGVAADRIARVVWEMTGGWPLYAEQVCGLVSHWQETQMLQTFNVTMNTDRKQYFEVDH